MASGETPNLLSTWRKNNSQGKAVEKIKCKSVLEGNDSENTQPQNWFDQYYFKYQGKFRKKLEPPLNASHFLMEIQINFSEN